MAKSSKKAKQSSTVSNCTHLGTVTAIQRECPSCGKNPEGKAKIKVKLHKCKLYGLTSLSRKVEGAACCVGCRFKTTTRIVLPNAQKPPKNASQSLPKPENAPKVEETP